jgi:hypothetical protein
MFELFDLYQNVLKLYEDPGKSPLCESISQKPFRS